MSAQSCLTRWDPIDGSLSGPSSMGFSRQEYWSELPFPTGGSLSIRGIEPESLTFPALAGRLITSSVLALY